MSRWLWIWRQLRRRLWLRASLIGMIGVIAAILATVVDDMLPWEIPGSIGVEAVDSILAIIASSMLAVTTFSLSVMVSAYSAATDNVTPRATQLLMQDRVTQNALSTFLGSFLFSMVGIVVLQTGAYGEAGRVVLFAFTIGVIVLIVVALLRWIDHLTRLGRVGETTSRVEEATRQALEARLRDPCLGALPLEPGETPAGRRVTSTEVGHVQHVDMAALSRCAEEQHARVTLVAGPGTFVHPMRPLVWIEGGDPDADDAMRATFTIAADRSFDQDPRFGLAVLAEIASRALSPGINDAGTALDVISRMTRLLVLWAAGPDPAADVRHPRLRFAPLRSEDLFEDAFLLIARDGADKIEVQLKLQKALAALAQMGDAAFRQAARDQARLALDRAQAALTLPADQTRLRAAAAAAGGA